MAHMSDQVPQGRLVLLVWVFPGKFDLWLVTMLIKHGVTDLNAMQVTELQIASMHV